MTKEFLSPEKSYVMCADFANLTIDKEHYGNITLTQFIFIWTKDMHKDLLYLPSPYSWHFEADASN